MADEPGAAAAQAEKTAKAGADRMRAAADDARAAFTATMADPARAGDAMKETGQKMAEGGATIGVRMIDQAEENTRQAFAAMRSAAEARDLSDVMKIQGDYLREQGARSMTQAREIGDLIMQFGRDAVTPLRRND